VPREILYEFTAHGRFVKVTAMDPDTLTEVVLVGDPLRGEDALMNAAKRKLEYVLNRQRERRPGRFV
jgi:hypothetical protein